MMNVGTFLVQLNELDPDLQMVILQSAEPDAISFGFEMEERDGVVCLVPLGPTAPLS